MAIIDEKLYMIMMHINSISNAFYNCKKGNSYCERMLKKLEFYDREEVMSIWKENWNRGIYNKEIDKEKHNVKPVKLCDKNEKYFQVVPLDKNWLGVLIADKNDNINKDRVIYISNDGIAFVSDEIEPLYNGCVPVSVYLRIREKEPLGFYDLDKKYYDGNHDEFLLKFWRVVKDSSTHFLFEMTNDPNVTIYNVDEYIMNGFKNAKTPEERMVYEQVDFAMSGYDLKHLIEFEKYYFSKYPDKIQKIVESQTLDDDSKNITELQNGKKEITAEKEEFKIVEEKTQKDKYNFDDSRYSREDATFTYNHLQIEKKRINEFLFKKTRNMNITIYNLEEYISNGYKNCKTPEEKKYYDLLSFFNVFWGIPGIIAFEKYYKEKYLDNEEQNNLENDRKDV